MLLAKDTGVHYHVCHISTADSVHLVRIAKDAGINVTAEVTPHHLLLSDSDIVDDDANFKMNPPLRGKNDRQALIEGLQDGTIDMIATDHAPHAEEEKNKGFLKSAFGITGIETSFPLMYTNLVQQGVMTLEGLLNVMATKPAKLFGIEKAGEIVLGQPADFTIIDVNHEYEIAKQDFISKGVNSPFIGDLVSGFVEKTFVNGSTSILRKFGVSMNKPVIVALDFADDFECIQFLSQFPKDTDLFLKIGLEMFCQFGYPFVRV